MTRLFDGERIAEITMIDWDKNTNEATPDWSADFFEVGGLEYDEEHNAYKVEDVDYCLEMAEDWSRADGDFFDDAVPEDWSRADGDFFDDAVPENIERQVFAEVFSAEKHYFLVDDATHSLGRFETMLIDADNDDDAIRKAEFRVSYLTPKELAKRDAVYLIYTGYGESPDFPDLDNARTVKEFK